MQRIIATAIVTISCFLLPRAGWSAAPSDSQRSPERRAQVARILPDQLTRFREESSRALPALEPVLAKHGVNNQSVFVIELEPGVHYALRYYEYNGNRFVDDLQELELDPKYNQWPEKLDEYTDDRSDVKCVFFTEGQRRSSVAEDRVRRIGRVVGLRPNMVEPYALLHAHTWPGVLAAIREGNIRNYSIFLAPIGDKMYLFAYLEYVGKNFDADMARIGDDPDTKAWIKFTDDGCQLPIPTRKTGEWWASMERL
jgi:L-rhamnose mutarotase